MRKRRIIKVTVKVESEIPTDFKKEFTNEEIDKLKDIVNEATESIKHDDIRNSNITLLQILQLCDKSEGVTVVDTKGSLSLNSYVPSYMIGMIADPIPMMRDRIKDSNISLSSKVTSLRIGYNKEYDEYNLCIEI